MNDFLNSTLSTRKGFGRRLARSGRSSWSFNSFSTHLQQSRLSCSGYGFQPWEMDVHLGMGCLLSSLGQQSMLPQVKGRQGRKQEGESDQENRSNNRIKKKRQTPESPSRDREVFFLVVPQRR